MYHNQENACRFKPDCIYWPSLIKPRLLMLYFIYSAEGEMLCKPVNVVALPCDSCSLSDPRNIRVCTSGLTKRTTVQGSHSFTDKKIPDFSRTFQDPMKNFLGPFWSPRMFKYKEKTAFTYNIQSVVQCRKFSMKQNVI